MNILATGSGHSSASVRELIRSVVNAAEYQEGDGNFARQAISVAVFVASRCTGKK